MGFRETIQRTLSQNRDRIGGAIDKAGSAVDRLTKGRYTERIDSGTRRAKEAIDRLDEPTPDSAADDSVDLRDGAIDPEPVDIDLDDVKDALPGARGGPDTPPGQANAPIPPG